MSSPAERDSNRATAAVLLVILALLLSGMWHVYQLDGKPAATESIDTGLPWC